MAPRSRLLPLLLLALLACSAPPEREPVPEGRGALLDRLAAWMTGTFSSAAQAAEQPDDFLEIRLVVVPIWERRADGPWLYVEQAAGGSLERPYRQRVYRVSLEEDGGFRSEVYELPGDVQRFVAAWDGAPFDDLEPDDLLLREGCAVLLDWQGDRFSGGTRGRGCESRLGRATHATSEVTVTADRLESWDRGYAADGEQVWGSEAGPYRFDRLSAGAPR